MPEQFVVHTLRVALPAGLAPDQARRWPQQAARAIEHAELAPRGFPPHAVLVVRRLIAPAPAELWVGQPWQAGPRWSAAARPALEACWRTAVRPTHTPVPAGAMAVWFADMAEWLACFSRDLARGDATQRWWWSSWLAQPQAHAAPTVAVWWRAEARWLPGAVAWLQRHAPAELLTMARSLPAAECRTTVLALTAAYALPSPAPDQLPPVVRRLIPVAAHLDGLRPEQRALVELALALFYAPGAVRAWLADSASAPPGRAPESAPPAQVIEADAAPPVATLAQAADNSPSAPAGRAATAAHEADQARPDAPDHPPEARALSPSASVAPPSISASPDTPADTDSWPSPGPERPEDSPSPAPMLDGATGIATSLGGIWYLINPLLALGWLNAAGQISPWLLLRALAEALLHGQPPDSVWDVLVALAAPVDLLDSWPAAQQCVALHLDECAEWLELRDIDLATLAAGLTAPATLYVTRTHIDLMFRLDQIDLSLRQAGLDRNPGWVHDLARIITFHFE